MNDNYNIYGNDINIKYSSPESGISEDFDFSKKRFYITKGVENLLSLENENQKKIIATNIICKVCKKAKIEILDYFLKVEINGTETWLIDNGYDICLMLPEEY